jgi:hypothetical protein
VRVKKSRRMRGGHVARIGEERGVYRVGWGNPRERDHWGWWEDNIEIDHQEVGCGGMEWIGLA